VRPVDVAVVGGGIVGCAVADRLSQTTSLRIAVFERGTPGCEASGAAAGVLAVASGKAPRGALFELRCASAEMFPELVAQLEDETGVAIGYRRGGMLVLAASEDEAAELVRLAELRRSQGFDCEVLSRPSLHRRQQGLHPRIGVGVVFHDEATVDSAAMVRALVARARLRGVHFVTGTAVRAVVPRGASVDVVLGDTVVAAEQAVIAAGAWSGEVLSEAAVRVPLRPARGEMVALSCESTRLCAALKSGETYLITRDGEILVGSTNEFAGFDKEARPDTATMLVARAAALVPGLARARLRRHWVGLRPCPTIRRPIISRLPGFQSVVLATGHHRSGIVLAPITARLVADLLLGEPPSVDLEPFAYRRR
jgi:glycine oxidase